MSLTLNTSSDANNIVASGQISDANASLYFIKTIEYGFKAELFGSQTFSVRVNPSIVITDSLSHIPIEYKYTEKKCFENVDSSLIYNRGKILNCYAYSDFPNKWQWGMASRLPLHRYNYNNHGDLPTPFIVRYHINSTTSLAENSVISVSLGDIKVAELIIRKQIGGDRKSHTLIWNSKLGVIVDEIEGATSGVLVPFSGEGVQTLEAGETFGLLQVPTGLTTNVEIDYIYY